MNLPRISKYLKERDLHNESDKNLVTKILDVRSFKEIKVYIDEDSTPTGSPSFQRPRPSIHSQQPVSFNEITHY